ncbi:AsmA-like C-terminal region-containing protein [Methylobacterium sp. J-076]|uniref:AsmA family protein n=1 Tax=Methylobacterium sp. J-076 TaxID=2836655 RepID=UPI001FB9281F|nr:AsmA-like C-terminal region-containing protein [Methylobacterium sp. J-076]MCJ2014670.1 AsmA family protein [Methylobacterium sp. J-076]
MSPRRPIIALALGALVLAGLGLRDWPVEGRKAVAYANGPLASYGLTLTAEGSATVRLLPLPSLSLSRVRVADASGPVLLEGDHLTADLDPLSLVSGRAPVDGLTLDGGRISDEASAWAGPLGRLREGGRGGLHPPRIVLRGATLGDGAQARAIDLDIGWPFWSGAVALDASLTWRGVPTRVSLTRLRPTDLIDGHRSPFAAQATWPGGSLAFDGTALLPAEAAGSPSLSGRARFETASLPETLGWIGCEAPLGPLAGAFSLEGAFEAQGRAVSWPVLRVGAGSAVLEGAGAFSLGMGEVPRLSAQATLAADRLDLGPLAGALVTLLADGSAPVALAPLSRGDLDLRISASQGQVGPLAVGDLAASVLVRDAAVEMALNRARLKDGILKGRLTLVRGADPTETDMRAQGGLDQVDLGGLMSDLGSSRWVSGPLQGQFSVESHGRDVAALVAGLGGRASLAIDGGALSGLDLTDVIHRNGGLAPGALARRNGRTGFERAAVVLRFTDGIGEITEADLRGAGVAATLRGQVSLPAQRLDMVALLAPRQAAEGGRTVRIAITGPWDAPTAQAQRGDADDPAGQTSSLARMRGILQIPAAIGLPVDIRAYAP